MQEIAKGQYSIYFNIPRLLFTLKLLLDLARDSILCTFSIWTLLHLLTVKSNFLSDLSCCLVPIYKIFKFEKFDIFARMIIPAVLKFAHLGVREK